VKKISSSLSNNDIEPFDQLKLKISDLLEHLWTAKKFMGESAINLASELRKDALSLIDSTIWRSNDALYSILHAGFDDPSSSADGLLSLHNSTRSHLDWMHEASLKLQNLTDTAANQLNLQMNHADINDTFWSNLQAEVGNVTDKLQEDRPNDFVVQIGAKDKKLETVVAMDDYDEPGKEGQSFIGDREPALMIMDSRSNQYVLSHPSGIKYLAAHSEDPSLIKDLILLILLAVCLGLLFDFIGLPAFFGNLLAGLILGPSCFNSIRNIVQVTSIGQIGALLLLLELGREFSLKKLTKFSGITLFGTPFFSLLCALSWGVFGRFVLGSGFGESCFIGLMVSFTSTAVSVKCLGQGMNQFTSAYLGALHIESIVSGVLLMQDAIFSSLISVLPVLAGMSISAPGSAILRLTAFFAKATLCSSLTYGCIRLLMPRMDIPARTGRTDIRLEKMASCISRTPLTMLSMWSAPR